MGFRIQNNIASMTAQRYLGVSEAGMNRALEKLSSGFRINKAADDATGLAVSMGMRADIASYKVASRNVAEANALLQVAEGAYDQISNILTRLKELATQGTSSNSDGNETDIQNEVSTLKAEITRIANSTEYNGTQVLTGYGMAVYSYSSGIDELSERATVGLISVDIGGVTENQVYTISATDSAITVYKGSAGAAESESHAVSDGAASVNFASLGITLNLATNFVASNTALDAETLKFSSAGGTFVTGTKNDANHYLTVNISAISLGATSLNIDSVTGTDLADLDSINTAIETLASSRAEIGAKMNQLGYEAANLSTIIENTQAAESVIRDADMAMEMSVFTKNQILVQAGTAMLAQANLAPQAILSLLS
jgi:flagellin